MRLSILTPILALLATTISAESTVNCWGKALHPEWKNLELAIRVFYNAIENQNPNFPAATRAEKRSCTETFCTRKTSIRFCNHDENNYRIMPLPNILDDTRAIMAECVDYYKGKKVAGGMVDHGDDNWSLVIQEKDYC